MAKTAKTIGARELVMGASNKYSPDDQLDQIALYWLDVCKGEAEPLTVRVLSKERDVSLDIAGGGRIPRIGERSAASAVTLAELRASWHGVESILLAYDGSALSMDFLDTVLSFLDPDVSIILVNVAEPEMIQTASINGVSQAEKIALEGVMRAQELGRQIRHRTAQGEAGEQIVRIAVAEKVDAIFMSLRGEYRRGDTTAFASNTRYVLEHAPCRVILGFAPKTINAADAAD
jgi:nucleotide-binding universal stress UspA family protein